jgi:hypothetical protein
MTQVKASSLSSLQREHTGSSKVRPSRRRRALSMRAPLIGAVALAGIAFVVTPPSVSAAPLSGVAKAVTQQTQTTDFSAQKKPKKGGGQKVGGKKGGGPKVGGKKGGPGPAAGRGGSGSNIGAAATGAAIGLAIGVILNEAARQQQAVQDCIDQHPSYNPNTRIWVDRHGGQHRCP